MEADHDHVDKAINAYLKLPLGPTQAKILDSVTAVHRCTTAILLSFTAIYCHLLPSTVVLLPSTVVSLQSTAVLLPSTEVLMKFYWRIRPSFEA